jgi:membrane-associated phospholipid phosphatase
VRTDLRVALFEERPPTRGRPPLSRTRKLLIGSTLAAYAAVVIGVLTTSWLVRLDWQVMLFRPYKQWPEFHALLDVVVVLGQRGPTALIVLAWLSWRSWKHRDLRPLLVLGLALLLLNITVGSVKYGLGRLGPHYATAAGSAELFGGGDIFPSGHTANAVVTWGVLAYLATKHRRTGAVITAAFALTVGLTTIYLGTHWVTDVLAGWTAGILVMLVLPLFEPGVAWADLRIRLLWARFRRSGTGVLVPSPIAARGVVSPREAGGPQLERPTVGAGVGSAPHPSGSRVGDQRLHRSVRPHATRHDHPPVAPAGSRRTHGDYPASRTAPLGSATRGRGPG